MSKDARRGEIKRVTGSPVFQAPRSANDCPKKAILVDALVAASELVPEAERPEPRLDVDDVCWKKSRKKSREKK